MKARVVPASRNRRHRGGHETVQELNTQRPKAGQEQELPTAAGGKSHVAKAEALQSTLTFHILFEERPRVRVLVTGGAGYIGSTVADLLVSRGHSVTVLDNLSKGHREAVPARAEIVPVDIGRRAAPASGIQI